MHSIWQHPVLAAWCQQQACLSVWGMSSSSDACPPPRPPYPASSAHSHTATGAAQRDHHAATSPGCNPSTSPPQAGAVCASVDIHECRPPALAQPHRTLQVGTHTQCSPCLLPHLLVHHGLMALAGHRLPAFQGMQGAFSCMLGGACRPPAAVTCMLSSSTHHQIRIPVFLLLVVIERFAGHLEPAHPSLYDHASC